MTTVLTPVIDDATRREFLTLLGAAGLLTGCTSSSPSTAPAPATRTVTDQTGRTVEVPTDPQRIVTLDPSRITSDLIALGLEPVGAATNTFNGPSGFSPLWNDAARRIVPVGAVGDADLEQVAALIPDLILCSTAHYDLDLDVLTRIAPVIAYDGPPNGLFAPLRWVGEVLDIDARAAEVESAARSVIDAARPDAGLDGRRVAAMYFGSGLFAPDSNIGELVGLLGGLDGRPETVAGVRVDSEPEELAVSPETIAEALGVAEVIVALTYPGPDQAEITSAPLWRSIPAVAAGRVAFVDGQSAYGNLGIAGLTTVLDDLRGQLNP